MQITTVCTVVGSTDPGKHFLSYQQLIDYFNDFLSFLGGGWDHLQRMGLGGEEVWDRIHNEQYLNRAEHI